MTNSTVENAIRAFGMSGLQISDDVARVADEFGLDFGRVRREEKGEKNLSQFEESIRNEAAEMAHYYQLFYCLEKSIRTLISENLREAHGPNWWASECVPQQVKDEVKKRQDAEFDSGIAPRSDDKMDFTSFGELEVLITKNWDVFETIFDSRRAVQRVLSSLNLLRGPIAHCCSYSEDEKDRLVLTVKDWIRML